MSDHKTGVPHQEPPTEDAPAMPEQKFVMPALTAGPASFYDTDSKSFWVGIPVGGVDILGAWASLDRVKLDLLQTYQREAIEQQSKSKIVKPWHEKARENGASMLKKLGIQ